MTKPALLELPEGVRLEYLAEGGANVIYRFIATSAKPARPSLTVKDPIWQVSTVTVEGIRRPSLPPDLQGKLLRLRKTTSVNTPYKEIVENFNTVVRPLFNDDELVDQTLVRLPDGLVHYCNEHLHSLELAGLRPTKRHGESLCPDEPFGLLITDMTTFDEPGTILAEFKPKWLTQSPSAPETAHRCRTCALREMKNAETRMLGSKEHHSFCPLDLVSERFEDVFQATTFIPGCNDRSRLARILYLNPTLRKLQSQQKSFGKVGLYGPREDIQTTSLGMTLRDCTMFVKIPRDEMSPVEIRLGDLDMKLSTGGKAEYWQLVELQLIDGGWYRGSNKGQNPSNCSLNYAPKANHHEAKSRLDS